MLHGDLCSYAVSLMSGHRAGLKARKILASLFSAAYHSPRFSYLLSLFSYFPQGILHPRSQIITDLAWLLMRVNADHMQGTLELG